MVQKDASIQDILDELCDEAQGAGDPTVGKLIEAIDNRSFAPLFIVLPLIGLTPLAAAPTMPTLLALLIGLMAVQMVLGRDHLWLPDWLRKREIGSDRMMSAVDKLRPVARHLDQWLGRRLAALVDKRSFQIAGVLILILCLVVPPLELVPGAAALPMLAITLFGLALFFRDGVVMLVAYLLAATAFLSLMGLI